MKTSKICLCFNNVLKAQCMKLVKPFIEYWNRDYEDDHKQFTINEENIDLLFQPVIDKSRSKIIGVESIPTIITPAGRKNNAKTLALLNSERYRKKSILWQISKIENAFSPLQHLQDKITISINVLPVQLKDHDILSALKHLHVSLSEHFNLQLLIMDKELDYVCDDLFDSIDLLKNIGYLICITHFGVSSYSLAYLGITKIDSLQLAPRFSIVYKEKIFYEKLLSGLMSMANDIGIQLSIRGITKIKQSDLLLNIGITIQQGDIYGKPSHLEEIIEKLD